MEINSIQLKLSLSEVNSVLTALGSLPYTKVYEIIQKIQVQTEQELQKHEQLTTGENEKQTLNGYSS